MSSRRRLCRVRRRLRRAVPLTLPADVDVRGGAAIPSRLPPPSSRYAMDRDAFALADKVKKAGDFKRYARAHQRRYGSILDKCFGEVAIPRDVQAIIALFLAPWGGS